MLDVVFQKVIKKINAEDQYKVENRYLIYKIYLCEKGLNFAQID